MQFSIEKTQLLTDIHSRRVDYEKGFLEEKHSKQEKKDKEKATAEEMRRMAWEKLGERSKRQEPDTSSRKRKGSEFIKYLKHKHESNRENTEKQLKIREEELKLEKQRLDVQQNMQTQMLEQLKMPQESQQAMFNLILVCQFSKYQITN